MVSDHYDCNKNDLFFEQCFIVEGSLGCGSFGKVDLKVLESLEFNEILSNFILKVYRVISKEDNKYYAVKKSREKFKGLTDR